MSLTKISTIVSVLAIAFAALTASASPFDRGGWDRDRGRGGWDRDRGHDRGRGGWDRDHGRDRDRDHGHGGWGRGRQWRGAGQQCGPYQPWGTSLACPNMSPNGGPQGMNCDNVPRGTRCYGASYWHNGYNCTAPNGQGSYGSLIFNMYVCD